MAIYIFSIQLINDRLQTITNGNDIGYYSSSAPYYFHWVEKDLSSYSPTLPSRERILIPEGIGDTNDRVDIELGGNLPSYNLFTIKIASSLMIGGTLTQFDKILAANEISLMGLQVVLRRYEIVSGALVNPNGVIEAMGVVEDVSDSDTVFSIGVNRPSFQRRSQMMKKIYQVDYPNATGDLIGKNLPLTLGQFKPEIVNDEIKWQGLAKLTQTSNKEDIYKNSNQFLFTGDTYPVGIYALSPISQKYLYSVGESVFPVTNANPNFDYPAPYHLEVQIGSYFVWENNGAPLTTGNHDLTNLIGYYIKIVDGTGRDEYRKIIDASVNLSVHGANTGKILLEIDTVFSEIPIDNADPDNQSWVSFIQVNDIYTADFWPCVGFIDSNGNELISETELYYYTKPRDIKNETTVDDSTSPVTVINKSKIIEVNTIFSRLPSFIFASDQVDKNNISLLSTGFTENQQKVDSFLILPFNNYEPIDIETSELASVWNEDTASGDWVNEGTPGVLRDDGSNTFFSSIVGNTSLLSDKDILTKYRIDIMSSDDNTCHALHGMTVKLPAFPKNFKPDAVYLGINANLGETSDYANTNLAFRLKCRRHTGLPKAIIDFDEALWIFEWSIGELLINSLPSFYYDSHPLSRNEYFYPNTEDLKAGHFYFTGYRLLELPGFEEKNNYNSIQFLAYFFDLLYGAYINEHFYIDIYQLVLIFKKSVSIGTTLYSPYKGRIFNDTWDSRKGSQIMISTLIDYIEMSLRLQNWSELSAQPVIDWGKVYAEYAKIYFSTQKGGFEYPALDSIKAFTPAIQLLNENEGWTDTFIKRICMGFFLVQYTDLSTGTEKIEFIGSKDSATPPIQITLDDIYGKISPIRQKRNRGIYCEPIIRYAKNPGTKKYDKEIKIMKTDDTEANFDAAVIAGELEKYVVGLTGAEAKLTWIRGHILWLNTRRVEEPPKTLTDNDFLWKDDDVKALLNIWFTYMGAIDTDGTPSGITFEPKKHFSFSVPYELGKDYQIMDRIQIYLPHQTDNVNLQAIMTSVNKQRKNELVNVEIMLYGSSTELAMFWQDISYNSPTYADVQDDSDLQSEEPTNAPDVQDFS